MRSLASVIAQILKAVRESHASFNSSFLQYTHSKYNRKSSFLLRGHLKSPEHGHWENDNNKVVDQTRCCCIKLEGGQTPTMATRCNRSKTVGYRFTYEANCKHDRNQDCHINSQYNPANQLERPHYEDADIKEQHRSTYSNRCRIPHDVDSNKNL